MEQHPHYPRYSDLALADKRTTYAIACLMWLTLFALVPALAARVGSASHTKMPGDLLLADIDGDGKKDFVGYSQDTFGFKISAASTDYPFTKIAEFDSRGGSGYAGVFIDKIWTGRFQDKKQESVCFRTKDTRGYYWYDQKIYCLHRALGYSMPPEPYFEVTVRGQSSPAQWMSAESQVAVGDFDGDGYDELLTYSPNGYIASDMHVFGYVRYNATSGAFGLKTVNMGELKQFTASGMIEVHVGNFEDFVESCSGWQCYIAIPKKRSDLMVFNRTLGQIVRYDARGAERETSFFRKYNTTANFVEPREELRVADADGDGFEDVIIHDTLYGNNRFLAPQSGLVPMPYAKPLEGQLPWYGSASEHHTYFGLMKNIPGEDGNTNTRDDALVYFNSTDSYARYDARFSGSSRQTYWFYYQVPRTMIRNAMGLF